MLPAESEDGRLGGRRLAATLFGIQILAGLSAGLCHEVGGYNTPEADFYGGYAPQAHRLGEGLSFQMTRSGPGYSVMLAIANTVCDDLFVAAKILAAMCVAAIGWFSYAIAARVTDHKTGVLLQALLYIALFRYSFIAGNDIPTAALSVGALYFALKEGSRGWHHAGFSGILAGMAVTTRFSAVAALVGCAAAILSSPPIWSRHRQRLSRLTALMCGAALPIGTWLLMNMKWHGTLLYGKAHALIALDAYGATGSKVSQAALGVMENRFDSIWQVLSHDPRRLLAYYPLDFYQDMHQLLGDVVTFPAYLLIGLGAYVLCLNSKARRLSMIMLIYAATAFMLVALAPYQARYHYPIAPVLFLPIAAAIASTPAWGGRAGKLRIVFAVPALAVLTIASGIKTREYLTSEPLEILQTSEVLRANARPGDRVLVRKAHLAYLAGIEADHRLADPDGGPLLEWLREGSKARFLYVGPLEVVSDPALAPLAYGRNVPPGFQLLQRTESPPSALYRIGGGNPVGK